MLGPNSREALYRSKGSLHGMLSNEELDVSKFKKPKGEKLGQEHDLEFLAKKNGTNFFTSITK